MSTGFITIYVTTGDAEEARLIAHTLVGERLVACANILDGMSSVYIWNDKVQQDNETVLLLKAKAADFDTVSARIRALHSYDCPCIVAWPIIAGSADYLDWIAGQVRCLPKPDPDRQ